MVINQWREWREKTQPKQFTVHPCLLQFSGSLMKLLFYGEVCTLNRHVIGLSSMLFELVFVYGSNHSLLVKRFYCSFNWNEVKWPSQEHSDPHWPGTMCSFQSFSINILNSVNDPFLIIALIWCSAGPCKSSSHQSLCKSHLDVGLNTATVWNAQRDSKPLETKQLFIFNMPGCFISKCSLILGNHQSLSRWRDKSCWTDNKSSVATRSEESQEWV